MTTIRKLGTSGVTVDFVDGPYIVGKASDTDEALTLDIVEDPIRGAGLINLSVADVSALDFAFEVDVLGTSWSNVLSNIQAIRDVIGTPLSLAERWSTHREGEQVTYKEAYGDQAIPTTWNVKRGTLRERRSMRFVTLNRTTVVVGLHCEPYPV